ncbi:MFS transporter [Helcobacillus massiliensis]|uniref:MFS family permease n=1 Tax=Helcobacillus massiliensis TaxID=521392 RepID=A0A839QSX9_9MICO|nr:MFS transporter [Helcobacillus massiliensis]MBB3021860.1 MFS family permease [Helcobacillus massiliensis]MCT1557811.1 MFS transporter [Helcobacillus massiliensis]MCT2036693.1 MFS transporter [Helcobacillus massiliensis]MCT2332164.1 MFS transporter [Helcobacillus massiliensis]
MNLSAYKAVLAQPKAASIFLLGFLARFPFSTTGLLLTLHCVLTLHVSFTQAGLLVTAATLGAAISAPWRGRLLDKQGLRRTLVPPIIVNGIVWMTVPWLPYAGVLPLVFLGGLFSIPVFSIVRTSLAVIVPARMRRTAFALDSVFTEFVFMTGPALATVLVYSAGSRPTMILVGVLIVAAGLGLMVVDPPLRTDQIMLPTHLSEPLETAEAAAAAHTGEYNERRVFEDTQTGAIPVVGDPAQEQAKSAARTALLSWGGISILVSTAVGSMLLVATDVAFVALLREIGQEGMVGPMVSIMCAGSAIGGIVYGAMRTDVGALWILLLMGLLILPLALTHALILLIVFAFLAGTTIAPLLSATGEAIAQKVPEEGRSEAMGWHGSSLTIGAAMGGPIFGSVIDVWGANWGFGAAGLVAIGIAGAGLIAMRIRRGRVRRRLAATVPGLS